MTAMQLTMTLGCLWLVLGLTCSVTCAQPTLLSERGSERATTGPGNNIVSFAGKTHVVWQDSDEKGYWNKVRTLDRATGAWSETVTLGPGIDNHARPCIAVDSRGFLHVIIGGHNTPCMYLRSAKANDSSAWSKAKKVDDGTYPMLVCGPDDTLVLALRPKTHNGANLYVKSGDEAWQVRPLVFRRDKIYSGYVGYNVALAWGPKGQDGKQALHLTADVYEGRGYVETRGIHQAIVYMVSYDLGQTWQKNDGQAIIAEPRSDDLDLIAQKKFKPGKTAPPTVLRNGGLVVDDQNRPYVYFTDSTSGVGKARLVMPDGKGQWRDLPLDEAVSKRWPGMHVPGARGQLSMGPGNSLHVQVSFTPIPDKDSPPERFSVRFGIGLLSSTDGGQTFTARELLAYNVEQEITQPTLERPVGHNDWGSGLPGMIYTVGPNRYPDKATKEVIDDDVFWLQP